MRPDGEDVARILALIDALPRDGARRAAVLGVDAEVWEQRLRSRGFEVRTQSDASSPPLAERSVEVIVVAGLERLQWDRWTLQQAHRALTPNGHLVVAVASFHAMTSPSDLLFLWTRAVRELAGRARRALGLPPPRERFQGRRYRLSRLVATLESLGFSVTHRSSHGLGWLSLVASILRRQVQRMARTHVLLCRRGPSLFGSGGWPYPDPTFHREAFRRTHRRYLTDRERWLERHPRFRPGRVEEFDPARCRDGRVLVLAPHPDDELIGCGGTLARLIAHGAHVTILLATDGSEAASLWHADPHVRHTLRLEEAKRVGEAMGFETLVFWREDNAAFRARDERVRELTSLLEQLRPSLVFVPFVTDVHADHRTLSRMLARAIQSAAAIPEDTLVLNYQVWSLVPPNLFCEITDVVETQERALFLYETAMKVDDYVHFCQDRNYHDAVALTARPGFVEAYFAISARDYPDLVAAAEETDA